MHIERERYEETLHFTSCNHFIHIKSLRTPLILLPLIPQLRTPKHTYGQVLHFEISISPVWIAQHMPQHTGCIPIGIL